VRCKLTCHTTPRELTKQSAVCSTGTAAAFAHSSFMGNAFSDCAGSPAPALPNSQTQNDQTESLGCFNKTESTHFHLQFIHTTICEKIRSEQSDVNVIELVWRESAHPQKYNEKCKQFKAVSTSLKYTAAINFALRQKCLDTALCPSDFIEFLSNIFTGAYGNQTTLEIIWEICCWDESAINLKDKILACDIIQLCVEVSELAHYIMLDDAFESTGGAIVMKESRNNNRMKSIIQSLTSSLLEYARSCQQDSEYGMTLPADMISTDGKELVSKRAFMEWQRRLVPDLLNNSLAQFMRILFFGQPSRNYGRFVPILHSSKELTPRTASKLKEGEVLPIKSSVFGANHAIINTEQTSTDNAGRAASTTFNPEVFVFTTISRSKFGNKASSFCFVHYPNIYYPS
jgi:hypothetical protein